MKNQFFTYSLALMLIAMPTTLSAFAASSNDFPTLQKANVITNKNSIMAILKAHGHISTTGDQGAFGYGLLTKKGGNDAIIVTTTHKGVLDSEVQKDANDPVWHNHFVSLAKDNQFCGGDLAVQSITFEQPGDVSIHGQTAKLTDIPSKFTGTDALTNKKLTLEPGTDVNNVVSFQLEPHFDNKGGLQAVCVKDIKPADKINIS
jgi:hypothetical protein